MISKWGMFQIKSKYPRELGLLFSELFESEVVEKDAHFLLKADDIELMFSMVDRESSNHSILPTILLNESLDAVFQRIQFFIFRMKKSDPTIAWDMIKIKKIQDAVIIQDFEKNLWKIISDH